MSQAKSPIAWSAHLKRTLQLGDSARESVNFPILIEFNIFKEMNGETTWLIDNISKKNEEHKRESWLYFLTWSKNVYIFTIDWFHGSILPFPRRLKCHDWMLEVGIKQSMFYYFLLFDELFSKM